MVANQSIILTAAELLDHAEACRLARQALGMSGQPIVIDLSHTTEATTAAFARLVLLRRDLLQSERDIHMAGLDGQPARLFEVHRLEAVLPRLTEFSIARPAVAARRVAPAVPKPVIADRDELLPASA